MYRYDTSISKEPFLRQLYFEVNKKKYNEPEDPKSQLVKKTVRTLSSKSFSGEWKTNRTISDFSNTHGVIRLFLQTYHSINGPNRRFFYNYIIFIYDGDNKQNWLLLQNTLPISLVSNTTSFTIEEGEKNTKSTFENVNTASTFYKMKILNTEKTHQDFLNITFNYDSDSHGYNTNPLFRMDGTITKEGFTISFDISDEGNNSIFLKISNFGLLISILGFLQLCNSKTLMEQFAEDENEAMKVTLSN